MPWAFVGVGGTGQETPLVHQLFWNSLLMQCPVEQETLARVWGRSGLLEGRALPAPSPKGLPLRSRGSARVLPVSDRPPWFCGLGSEPQGSLKDLSTTDWNTRARAECCNLLQSSFRP